MGHGDTKALQSCCRRTEVPEGKKVIIITDLSQQLFSQLILREFNSFKALAEELKRFHKYYLSLFNMIVEKIYFCLEDSIPFPNPKEECQRKRIENQSNLPAELPPSIACLGKTRDSALARFLNGPWWESDEPVPNALMMELLGKYKKQIMTQAVFGENVHGISTTLDPTLHPEGERKAISYFIKNIPEDKNVFFIGTDTDFISSLFATADRWMNRPGDVFFYSNHRNWGDVFDMKDSVCALGIDAQERFKVTYSALSPARRSELVFRMHLYASSDTCPNFKFITLTSSTSFEDWFGDDGLPLEGLEDEAVRRLLSVGKALAYHGNESDRVRPFVRRAIYSFFLSRNVNALELPSCLNYGFKAIGTHVYFDGLGAIKKDPKPKLVVGTGNSDVVESRKKTHARDDSVGGDNNEPVQKKSRRRPKSGD